jgi:hypothetical protein
MAEDMFGMLHGGTDSRSASKVRGVEFVLAHHVLLLRLAHAHGQLMRATNHNRIKKLIFDGSPGTSR